MGCQGDRRNSAGMVRPHPDLLLLLLLCFRSEESPRTAPHTCYFLSSLRITTTPLAVIMLASTPNSRASLAVLAVSLLAHRAVAQLGADSGLPGYGRISCTNDDGTPNSAYCGNNPYDLKALCTKEAGTNAYYCGISGGICATNRRNSCDAGGKQACRLFGSQVTGRCVVTTATAFGAVRAHALVVTPGYCNLNFEASNPDNLYSCMSYVGDGGDCSADPDNACQPGLYAWRNRSTGECTCRTTPPPTASQRARTRRQIASLCPASYTACSLSDGAAFECLDTETNLEQCGGCANSDGVDCTGLAGVAAVGCVGGRCEAWACEAGFFLDSESATCHSAL
ncbi:hypothetical protein BMF94_0951 [Rhodotorula taiwanensis]|uniref:Protein CPL1-like domain-containing protein n=1 Tax=Rhodotorula taiwanensis TaxID=741276 RepID=A0A2S5BGH2_9BASI|nr:hypothetical protein BMF94_0951 [Rhodotorula taiwanensis]